MQITRSLRPVKLKRCSKQDAERYYWERAIPKRFWEKYKHLRELLVEYVADERFEERNGCRAWEVKHPNPIGIYAEKSNLVVFSKTKAGAIAEYLLMSRQFLRRHPIKKFYMECIKLEISLFRRICAQLIPMQIIELNLRNCSLGEEHCVALEPVIRHSPMLRIMKLGDNKLCGKLENARGLESIFKELLSDPARYLDELHLYRCGLGPAAADTIIKSLQSSMKEVKMGRRQHGIVTKRLGLSYNQHLKTYVESLPLNLESIAQESGLEILLKC